MPNSATLPPPSSVTGCTPHATATLMITQTIATPWSRCGPTDHPPPTTYRPPPYAFVLCARVVQVRRAVDGKWPPLNGGWNSGQSVAKWHGLDTTASYYGYAMPGAEETSLTYERSSGALFCADIPTTKPTPG